MLDFLWDFHNFESIVDCNLWSTKSYQMQHREMQSFLLHHKKMDQNLYIIIVLKYKLWYYSL